MTIISFKWRKTQSFQLNNIYYAYFSFLTIIIKKPTDSINSILPNYLMQHTSKILSNFKSTSTYLNLPQSTSIYLNLPQNTSIYLNEPQTTSTHIYVYLCISTYIYVHPFFTPQFSGNTQTTTSRLHPYHFFLCKNHLIY